MTDRTKDYEHDRRRHETAFANSIVDEWLRDACPECHGTGWADEGRPCEHPRGGV